MAKEGDQRFGKIAITKKFITPTQLKECVEHLRKEKSMGMPVRLLGELLVERGYMTAGQVEDVLETQNRLAGNPKLGPYELLGKIGEGGMGAVYRAKVMATGVEVALKILPRRLTNDERYVVRFKREARIGLEMDHPNIASTLDVGSDHAIHFMALEYLPDGSLKQHLNDHKRVSESRALMIVRDIARALQCAHEHGVVHRDVKPDNILFGRDGEAKLSDFGLVKCTDPEATNLTMSNIMLGSVHYISPEQACNAKDIDIRADIYSLGATFYHLVTGKRPFEGKNSLEIISKHLTARLPPPDGINPDLSDASVSVIEKMMAKEPDDRYETPAELISDLDLLLGGEEPVGSDIDENSSSVEMSVRRLKAARAMRRKPKQSPTDGPTVVRDRPPGKRGSGRREQLEVQQTRKRPPVGKWVRPPSSGNRRPTSQRKKRTTGPREPVLATTKKRSPIPARDRSARRSRYDQASPVLPSSQMMMFLVIGVIVMVIAVVLSVLYKG